MFDLTIKNVASETINALEFEQCSCVRIHYVIGSFCYNNSRYPTPLSSSAKITNAYLEEYRNFSNANRFYTGFNGESWDNPAILYDCEGIYEYASTAVLQARFNYRLEMLYYWWMANQDM